GFGVGAGRGSRTPKTRRSADFESAASASSAIPASGRCYYSNCEGFSFRQQPRCTGLPPKFMAHATATRPLQFKTGQQKGPRRWGRVALILVIAGAVLCAVPLGLCHW